VRHGWFFPVGPEDAVANYVHVDDVASALLSCATHPASRAQTFNLSNDCLWRDLTGHIAATLGVRARRTRIPEKPVRVMASVLGARLGNPLTHPRIDALVNRTRYPTTKIERVLGFRHARPMPESIDDLIGWSA
jgi:nucleoside-diphosphate-sugar epimerase